MLTVRAKAIEALIDQFSKSFSIVDNSPTAFPDEFGKDASLGSRSSGDIGPPSFSNTWPTAPRHHDHRRTVTVERGLQPELEAIRPLSPLNKWTTAPILYDPWSAITAEQGHPLLELPQCGDYTDNTTPKILTRGEHPTTNTPRPSSKAKTVHFNCYGEKWPVPYDFPRPGCSPIEKVVFKNPSKLEADLYSQRNWKSGNKLSSDNRQQTPMHSRAQAEVEKVLPKTWSNQRPSVEEDDADLDLSESYGIPRYASNHSLRPTRITPDEMGYLSQKEKGTSCSVYSIEPGSTESESEACSDDKGQDIFHTICKAILAQMLSGDPHNLDSSGSRYLRVVAGDRGESQNSQSSGFQGPSTPSSSSINTRKRARRDGGGGGESGGGESEGGRKEPNGQKGKSQNPRQLSKPCPYYLANPDNPIFAKGGTHQNCTKTFPRIIQHIRRSHLKPEQCPICGYRGDKGQVEDHKKPRKCLPPTAGFKEVDSETLRIDNLLRDKKDISWSEIFRILFGPDSPIPPEAEKYINFERAYPDILDALISFMQPELPAIIRRFYDSPEFMNIAAKHPGVNLSSIHPSGAISNTAALDVGGALATMISAGSVPRPPTPNPDAYTTPSPNITNSFPPTQPSHPSLIKTFQPPSPRQLLAEPGTWVPSGCMPRYPAASIPTGLGPSSFPNPDLSIPGSVHARQNRNSTVSNLVSSNISGAAVGIQTAPVSSQSIAGMYTPSQGLKPYQTKNDQSQPPSQLPHQLNANITPGGIPGYSAVDFPTRLVTRDSPSLSLILEAMNSPQDKTLPNYEAFNNWGAAQGGTVNPKVEAQTRPILSHDTIASYPSTHYIQPYPVDNSQFPGPYQFFDENNANSTNTRVLAYQAAGFQEGLAPPNSTENLPFPPEVVQNRSLPAYGLINHWYTVQGRISPEIETQAMGDWDSANSRVPPNNFSHYGHMDDAT